MPPLPAVPKVLRVTQRMQFGSDLDLLSRCFLQYSGSAPSPTQLDDFCTSAVTIWGVDLQTMVNSSVELVGIDAEDLSSPTAAIGTAVAALVGSRSGATLPAGVAAVIQFKIARRYRGGHPRSYWPGAVTTDETTPQTWHTTYLTDLTSAYQSWISDLEGDGWSGSGSITQVNVSYYSGFTNVLYPSGRYHAVPTLRAVPVVDVVAGIAVNPIFGSQRRRNEQP